MTTKRTLITLALGLLGSTLITGGAWAQTVNAKFSVTLPEKSHQGQGASRFADLVNQKTKGRLQVKVYFNAALGNDVQVTSSLQGGTIEFALPQTSTLTGMVKELEVLDFPFLFANEQEAEKILDGVTGQKLLDKLPAKGLIGLAYWENGFFNATNSKQPIQKWEDFQGLKFRAVQAKISQETVKALGANPVALAVPELYTALETRTIDGQGTPSAVTAALKLNEVQKYLSLTRHSYGAFVPLVSKKFWDTLPPADQVFLREAAVETRAFQRGVAREQAKNAETSMASKGLLINDITASERQRMRDKVKPVWDMFTADVGVDLVADVTGQLSGK